MHLCTLFLVLVFASISKALSIPFIHQDPPYLLLITERDSCDSEEKLHRVVERIKKATELKAVDLVSIRVSNDHVDQAYEQRVVSLANQVARLATERSFRVVLSSEWRHLLSQTKINGLHFKEAHRPFIPEVAKGTVIGTSAHSVESAVQAWKLYMPDYFVVGTCYLTESHPEKDQSTLEGPELPGQVRRALEQLTPNPPPVFAVGGIDASNCHEPVRHGANGVAVIRSILHAPNPAQAVTSIRENMQSTVL